MHSNDSINADRSTQLRSVQQANGLWRLKATFIHICVCALPCNSVFLLPQSISFTLFSLWYAHALYSTPYSVSGWICERQMYVNLDKLLAPNRYFYWFRHIASNYRTLSASIHKIHVFGPFSPTSTIMFKSVCILCTFHTMIKCVIGVNVFQLYAQCAIV